MSALTDLLHAFRRQADLLAWAATYDEVTLAPSPDAIHFTPNAPRRRWTRQDGNRFNAAIEAEESRGEPIDPGWMLDGEWMLEAAAPRMRTRVNWFVERFRRPPHSVESLRPAALADARDQGIYAIVAPLVVEAIEAHHQLIEAHEHSDDEAFFVSVDWDWDAMQSRWDAALGALERHLPDAPVALPPSSPAVDGENLSGLPVVVNKGDHWEVTYAGTVYRVDSMDAGDALKAMVDSYPERVGLKTVIGPHPERAINKLPQPLREIVNTKRPAGSTIKLP